MTEAETNSDETTTDRVYAQIRASIMSGKYPPGSQHSVYRLADELGVSRTPVREAVLRLADAGMVSVERNRGFTIRGATLRDIRKIFEYRIIIEVPAASYAALHGGDALVARLHDELATMRAAADGADEALCVLNGRYLLEAIMDVMGNPRLSATLAELRDATKLRWSSTEGPPVADRYRARAPTHHRSGDQSRTRTGRKISDHSTRSCRDQYNVMEMHTDLTKV